MKVENIIVLSQVLGKECSKCGRVKNVDCFDYIQSAGDVYLFQSGYLWSFLPEDTSNRLSI